MSSYISQNLTEIEGVTGCIFVCICHTVFRMFSCLQINWKPFYLPQLLKFHPFDWLIEIYLQTEGQGTHHKMVSLQPMPRQLFLAIKLIAFFYVSNSMFTRAQLWNSQTGFKLKKKHYGQVEQVIV